MMVHILEYNKGRTANKTTKKWSRLSVCMAEKEAAYDLGRTGSSF